MSSSWRCCFCTCSGSSAALQSANTTGQGAKGAPVDDGWPRFEAESLPTVSVSVEFEDWCVARNFRVDADDNILVLKRRVESATGIAVSRQKLLVGTKLVDDGQVFGTLLGETQDVPNQRKGIDLKLVVVSLEPVSSNALLSAVIASDVATVEAALQSGADPCLTLEDGRPPLLLAAQLGSSQMVGMLLRARADHRAAARDGSLPLHAAAAHDSAELIDLFFCYGAAPDPETKFGMTPLHIACREGSSQAFESLRRHSADVQKGTKTGNSSLHMAARGGHVHIAALLLAAGADLLHVTSFGFLALHVAALHGHVEMTRYLIVARAPIGQLTSLGQSPMHLAAGQGHAEVVSLLCELGAEVSPADLKASSTPLHLSARQGSAEVARILCEQGAEMNCLDKFGQSPLFLAACHGKLGAVRVLCEHGADTSVANFDGITPLCIASRKRRREVADYLKSVRAPFGFRLQFRAHVRCLRPGLARVVV